ncbi:MAG: hypothetical protein K6T16_01845 [Candidatus Pacearchaeota archaeon]|nr:hypothetical protein [Candidatus Pacearchaeota archaeon]
MGQEERHIYSINLNLEKILNRENRILIDSSFFSTKKNLTEGIYNKKSYKEIYKEGLQKIIDKIEWSIELLKNSKIMVLPETVGELQELQRIISEKVSFFEYYDRYLCKKNIKNFEYDEDRKEKKRLFEKICFLSLKGARAARIYKPKNKECYELFFNVVKRITEAERLKGRVRIPCWYKFKPRNEPVDNHTDEKIIAASLESIFTEEPLAVITKDYHLRLILEEVCNLLLCPELDPYNKQIIRLMKENPASVYYYNPHKESLPFFKEKLDKGWHVSRTNQFKRREQFELRANMGYRADSLTELKARHAIVECLIKAEKSYI